VVAFGDPWGWTTSIVPSVASAECPILDDSNRKGCHAMAGRGTGRTVYHFVYHHNREDLLADAIHAFEAKIKPADLAGLSG
jgi:hypothetical protein